MKLKLAGLFSFVKTRIFIYLFIYLITRQTEDIKLGKQKCLLIVSVNISNCEEKD